jgi:hypothetical protein
MAILFMALCVARGWPETIRWTNPTTDNTGTALSAADQAALKNFLRYRPEAGGSWTYFAETAGGKSSWVGTLPVAAGIAADYTVSAALTGPDGIERESAMSVPVRYTVPFPPGPTPGSPTGPTISRP